MAGISVSSPYTISSWFVTYSSDFDGRKSQWFDEMDQIELINLIFDIIDDDNTIVISDDYYNDYVEDADYLLAKSMLENIGIRCSAG